jgi:hypothetical protein
VSPVVGARVEFYQAANSTIDSLYTGFRDDLQQVGVDVPGHDPLDHLIASTHTDQNGSWSFHLHAVGDTGDPPFYARLVLDDDQGVRLFDGWAKFFDSWSLETARAGNNGPLVDYGTYEIARGGGSGTPKCAVWQGAHNAYQDYVSETGQTPPSPTHWISYGWPTSTPFTTIGQTNWPDGYETAHADEKDASGNYIDGGYAIDFHEFGHDIRHSLDGGLGEFLKDVVRYDYPQNHQQCKLPSGIDDTSKLGFAFNEGWAEFWAGTPQSCDTPTDFRYEGNVAAALTALTVGNPVCRAVPRSGLVRVLAANPGKIHSWREFLAAFRKVHPCESLSLQANRGPLRADWGGESTPFSSGLLRSRERTQLAGARTALSRLSLLVRRNPAPARITGCPPNCALALGQAIAPSVLSAMRTELALVEHEVELEQSGASGNALWRQLTSLKGITQADARARAFEQASSSLTSTTIAQALRIALPLERRRNAGLSKQVGDLQAALQTLKTSRRPGRLATWIEGIDSDLHRKIGPSLVIVPTQLSISCPAGPTSGTTATITGNLVPADGTEPILIDITGGPGGGQQSVTTNANGAFTARFVPGAAAVYTVAASYAGTPTRGKSATSCTLTVTNPIVSKGSSNLSLNCAETASPEQALTVTAQLTPPLQGASIDFSASGPGTAPPQNTTTDQTGLAYYNVTLGQVGSWTITARWIGDSTHTGSTGSCSIHVENASTTTITCPASPLLPSQAATITGTVTPAVNATPVTLTYTPPPGSTGTLTKDNVTTDNTGYFADDFAANAPGTWTATASFAGDSTRAPSTASCTFTVLSP